MSNVTHNMKVFEAGLRKFTAQLNVRLVYVGTRTADAIMGVMEDIADTDEFPVWSGNMMDGTGLGVYSNGTLTRFTHGRNAAEPQSHEGDNDIWGSDLIQQALSKGTASYSKGTWIVLMSSVPYAEDVDVAGSPWGRGEGFFDALSERVELIAVENLKLEFPKAIIR